MKFKQLLTKTLLVAAGLCVGVSAWADDYTSVYSRAAVTNWADDDKTDWNASSAVEVNATYGLGADANLTATYVNKTFTIGANNKVKYEVDWTFACATGRANNYNWIQFGDFLRIGIDGVSYNMQVSTNAGASYNTTALAKYSNTTLTKHIEVIFDTQLKTIEKFTWDGEDKTSLVAGTFSTATFNKISTGFVRASSVSWTCRNYLTTVVVSQAEQAAAAEATYTINYKYGGETIDTESGTSVEGTTIYAEIPRIISGQRYFATDDAITSKVLVAGANEWDVTLRLPNIYSYSVVARDGSKNKLADITSGSYTEGDDAITVAYSQYILSGTDLYPIGNNASGDYYRKTFTPNEDGYELTLTYGSPISNVVFFTEAEDVPSATIGNYTNRASNGKVGYTGAADTYLDATTIAPGKYIIYTKGLNGNKDNKYANFKLGENVFEFAISQGTNQTGNSTEFTIYTTSTLSFGSQGHSSNGGVDWFYVQRTGDATVSPTIGADGYATFSSDYALDFEHATGVNAYYSTSVSGNSAVMTKITGTAAAGEGLFLQKTDGEISIPVVATGTTLTGNLLMATDGSDIPASTEGAYNYVFAKQDGELGFYKVATALSGVAAGKAYLHTTTALSGTGARLNFTFDNETTGINNVNVNHNDNCYDLQGRRVAQPTKGLYIVNGKKVVIK